MYDSIVSWLRGDFNSVKSRFYYYPRDLLHYHLLYRIRGKSLIDFQAERLDKVEVTRHERPLDTSYIEQGKQQFEYLKAHGLQAKHRLLDYGCGFMRGGLFFIQYLNPGNYVGVDISAARLRTARQLLKSHGIKEENYRTFHLKDLVLEELAGITFDYVWSFSVFQYLPDDDFLVLIKSIRKLLAPGGKVYFDFPETAKPLKGKMQFYRSADRVEHLSEEAGYCCEIQSDWPLKSTMAGLTLR